MNYYVYLMTNSYNNVLYTGVTNNPKRRIWEHKNGIDKNCFTYRHNCTKLVYCEEFSDIKYAIEREKRIKKWNRQWKNALVEKDNLEWRDLWDEWFAAGD